MGKVEFVSAQEFKAKDHFDRLLDIILQYLRPVYLDNHSTSNKDFLRLEHSMNGVLLRWYKF